MPPKPPAAAGSPASGTSDATPQVSHRPHSKLTARVRRDLFADRAAFRFVASRARQPDDATIERVVVEVDEALVLFKARGFIDDPASYHRAPPVLSGLRTRPQSSGRIRYAALSWPDEYEVPSEEPGAERFASYRENRIARAAVLEHRGGDRPWIVCLHGFGMGSAGMDMRAFRALHLHRDLGLNVALMTLPLHGRRKPAGTRLAAMPSFDLLDNVHALAQCVWDVRQLVDHLRTRTAQPISVMGLSLGGYVTALVASLADVDASLLLIPAVDLPTLMIEAAGRFDRPIAADALERSRALLDVVGPLSHTPRVPLDRRLIIAATLDQFANPTTQALALWRHWDEPALHWFHGGHVGLFWAKGVQDTIDNALNRFGVLPS